MRIVIVGAVAGGMSAAARARRLLEDAEIIVLDKGDYASFANCGLPYYLSGEIAEKSALLVQTPESLKAALNLDVRLNHEVVTISPEEQQVTVQTEAGIQKIAYDHLILSPGAQAFRPDVPGLESKRVHTLRTINDVLAIAETVNDSAKQAVVLGSGFIGLEAAEALAHKGLEVTVVELAQQILTPLEPELAQLIKTELNELGVKTLTSVAAVAITDQGDKDLIQLSDGTSLAADLIILSVGVSPATYAFSESGLLLERGAIVTNQHGQTNLPNVWAIGDAVMSEDAVTGAARPIALAGPANRGGRIIADNIAISEQLAAGEQVEFQTLPKLLGTAIIRVGSLTAAVTGANSAALARAGIAFRTVHLHPKQHAGYFPGAKQMQLVAHFDEQTGKILGAGIVGADGVDKRIDILATAIKAGMDYRDLIELDLAYSPPYGQAKDAVNLLGMFAQNLFEGQVELWHGAELLGRNPSEVAGVLLIDNRSPAEYAKDHLFGAVNIPHTKLRAEAAALIEVAQGRKIKLICESGFRSYLAHRILKSHGVASESLSGGMLTLRAILAAAGELDNWLETSEKQAN